MAISFEPGREYARSSLPGQKQGGILTPRADPIVVITSRPQGRRHGYNDRWEPDGTFRYYGQGPEGDMKWERGYVAILNHVDHGEELHLFIGDTANGPLRYEGQMVCAGWEYEENVPDSKGNPRRAIAFRLVRVDDPNLVEPQVGDDSESESGPAPGAGLWNRDMSDLRALAVEPPPEQGSPAEAKRSVYRRSRAVRIYVLRRAVGICEGCGEPAPFVTPAGRPYLEPHHIRLRSDGGPDDPAWVIAVCPTCHRRAHYAIDGAAYNDHLLAALRVLEPGPE